MYNVIFITELYNWLIFTHRRINNSIIHYFIKTSLVSNIEFNKNYKSE